MFRDRPQIGIGHIRWFHFDGGTNRPSLSEFSPNALSEFSPMRSLNKAGAFLPVTVAWDLMLNGA